jgi:NADH-quinone oxidoreductase subunit N
VGKFYLFSAVIGRGGTWYWVLAVIGVLNSVVSLYYYARILQSMYLSEPSSGQTFGRIPLLQNLLLAFLALSTILIGIYWTPLAQFAAWGGF